MIDCFHRIRSLFKLGVKVHLHAFEYGRPHSQTLENMCSSVTYYRRDTSLKKHFSLYPYSVISRKSDKLIEDLKKDDFPILFDGIQTTICIDNKIFEKRKKAVRIHNIEPEYYLTLAGYEKNPLKKLYYSLEALKLRRYETILKRADYLLTVSIVDHDYYDRKFHNSVLIPSSHPYDNTDIMEGKGDYILYHGDLSVNENIAVSRFLISKIFSKIPFRCIIAGKDPPKSLTRKITRHNNIKLVSNPDNDTMSNLIRNAQINILPTMAANGLKLKLLISLYCGRHCLVNSTTINGSGLYSLCHVADSDEKMIKKITELIDLPFPREMIEERKKLLTRNHDNITNAVKLIGLFFPD